MAFTGAPAAFPISFTSASGWEAEIDENVDRSIWILDGSDSSPKPLVASPHSIFHHLSMAKLYRLRLYVLLPPDSGEKLKEIRACVRRDTDLIPWTGL